MHGQVAHPDPFTAAMHAVRDERIDAILVSTFPEQRGSSWLRRDLVGRLTNETKVPVEHVVVEPENVEHEVNGERARRAPSRAAGREPELARQRHRARDVPLHRVGGDALRSFFTAYFFVRVVNPDAQPWLLEPFHLPVFVAGVNTAVLLTSSFTMHWALQSIKRGNRSGMKAGLVLTLLMGLAFLLTQMLEYARIGFNRATAPSARSSSGSQGCTAPTSSSG